MNKTLTLAFLALCSGFSHAQPPQPLPGSRFEDFGFTGDGQIGASQAFAASAYALEGNHDLGNCTIDPSTGICFYPGMRMSQDGLWRFYSSSTNPGELPTPANIKVIREVGKLEARLDGLGLTDADMENRLLKFFLRAWEHHAVTLLMGDPLGAIDWWAPNSQALVNSESYQIWEKLQEIRSWGGDETSWWEIGNEPNLWPSITPEQYADIFSSYYRVLKNPVLGSSYAQAGASIHSNSMLYDASSMMAMAMNQRLADYREIVNKAALMGGSIGFLNSGVLSLGLLEAAMIEPSTAVAIVAITTALGGIAGWIVDDAFDKAARDTRNALLRRLTYEDLPNATTNWFRDFVRALPDDTPPDFIGYHTYFLNMETRPDMLAITQTVNDDIRQMQLHWVEKFAPSDFQRIHHLIQQDPHANLSVVTVQTAIGQKTIPPVFITEFGNVLPRETSAGVQYMSAPDYFPEVDANGTPLIGFLAGMDGRRPADATILSAENILLPPDPNCPSVLYPPPPPNTRPVQGLNEYRFPVSICYYSGPNIVVYKKDAYRYSGGFLKVAIQNTDTHVAQEYIAPMVQNFMVNPNIHLWLFYKPQGVDAKFAQFGMEPAVSRLFAEYTLSPFSRNPIFGSQYGFPSIDWFDCSDLNAIGHWLYQGRFGSPCPTGTRVLAKTATSYFADGSWASPQGNLSPSTTLRPVAAPQALKVEGTGWRELHRRFTWEDLLPGGAAEFFTVDLHIPLAQSNPWWVGDVQMFISLPSQGLHNHWVGRQDLNTLQRGNWNRLVFRLTPDLVAKLRTSFDDLDIRLALNGSGSFHLDNLNFFSSTPKPFPSNHPNQRILGFEDALDWQCSQCTSIDLSPHNFTQGSTSLRVRTQGWNDIRSSSFDLQEIPAQAQAMSLDFYLSSGGDPWWSGALSASLDCPQAQIHSWWMGQHELTPLAKNRWHSLSFTLPPTLVEIPRDASPRECTIRLQLNTPGTILDYYFDNVRFSEVGP